MTKGNGNCERTMCFNSRLACFLPECVVLGFASAASTMSCQRSVVSS